MAEPDTDRLLTTGLMMGGATLLRAYSGCVAVWSERAPELAKLGAESREVEGDASRASAELRDELMALARECSEVMVRELQRGLEDLDDYTRPGAEASQPNRPYRTKP